MGIGDFRTARIAGQLGCHVHEKAYIVMELSTIVPGASRRFLLLCPIKDCRLAIRIVASEAISVEWSKVKDGDDEKKTEGQE